MLACASTRFFTAGPSLSLSLKMRCSSEIKDLLLCAAVLLLFLKSTGTANILEGSLQVGFYGLRCPATEEIVKKTVSKEVGRDPLLAAALIRMHFHDCFVRGCDGSILLDSTHESRAEKDHPINNPSIQGYDVVDAAKSTLESLCPRTVSCSDILAFAARDSALASGGIYWPVPAGRRDGRVSIADEVPSNIPSPFSTVQQLAESFARKGLTAAEMVALVGAHSNGVAHCSSFAARLYSSNYSAGGQDPSMHPGLAAYLKRVCPPSVEGGGGGADEPTVPLTAKNRPMGLNARYYENLVEGMGLLGSDQALLSSPVTAVLVRENVEDPVGWNQRFAAAMVRMGYVGVLTGHQGEIRENCRVVNAY